VTPAPLSLAAITAALDARGDHYRVGGDGVVAGRWGTAYARIERIGQRHEILRIRVVAARRLDATRLFEAYEFCNGWNHDRLLPKAFVVEEPDGTVAIAGDAATDLEHGVTPAQLAVLLNAALVTGATLAAAVDDLP
jgi:L-ascorbate metabolism protein UlaG (beta-lactamase superfamily)